MQILFGWVEFLINKMYFGILSSVSFILMIRKDETEVHFFWPIIYIYIYIYIVIHRQAVSLSAQFKEELCIMRAAFENSFTRVLNPNGRAYILSSTDKLFRCVTTLQCG